MSEPTGSARERYNLSAQPPLRALAIASGLTLGGAFIMVLGGFLHWPTVVLPVAGVVMAGGVALAIAALVMARRLHSTLLLDPDSITIVRGRRRSVLRWAEIEQVVLRGQRLNLVGRPGSRSATFVNPPGSSNVVFASLVESIRTRLDASRGYH